MESEAESEMKHKKTVLSDRFSQTSKNLRVHHVHVHVAVDPSVEAGSTLFLELNYTGCRSKKREIGTLTHVESRPEFVSLLPDDDVSGKSGLSSKYFHAEPLSVGITTVRGRSLGFLMCHSRVKLELIY